MCQVISYILTLVTFLRLSRKLVQLRNMLGNKSYLTICDLASFLYTSDVLNSKMAEDFNAHQIFPLLENMHMSYLQSHTCDTHNLKRASYEYGRMTLSLLICIRNRANNQVPRGKILLNTSTKLPTSKSLLHTKGTPETDYFVPSPNRHFSHTCLYTCSCFYASTQFPIKVQEV
jgi:hypothetical protein